MNDNCHVRRQIESSPKFERFDRNQTQYASGRTPQIGDMGRKWNLVLKGIPGTLQETILQLKLSARPGTFMVNKLRLARNRVDKMLRASQADPTNPKM
jgi:hypothetical protein